MRNLLLVSLFVLGACSAADVTLPPAVRDVRSGEEFDLALGEKVGVDEAKILLTFARVIADSRCPMNARCIWEGNAKVAIGVEEFSAASKNTVEVAGLTLELNTSGRFAKRQSFGKYDVTLVNVEPDRIAGQAVEKYVVTLRVDARP